MLVRTAYHRIAPLDAHSAFQAGVSRMAAIAYVNRARVEPERWLKKLWVDFARDSHHEYLRILGAI